MDSHGERYKPAVVAGWRSSAFAAIERDEKCRATMRGCSPRAGCRSLVTAFVTPVKFRLIPPIRFDHAASTMKRQRFHLPIAGPLSRFRRVASHRVGNARVKCRARAVERAETTSEADSLMEMRAISRVGIHPSRGRGWTERTTRRSRAPFIIAGPQLSPLSLSLSVYLCRGAQIL